MNKLGFEEFLKLQEAGFANEQIRVLNDVIESHASIDMHEEQPQQEEQLQETNKQNDALNEVMKMLGGIENKIIQQNISNSKQPEQESTTDILASIISPKKKEG